MKKYLALFSIIVFSAYAKEVIPLTVNPNPQADYVTFEEWLEAHPEAATRSTGPLVRGRFPARVLMTAKGLIALVVAENMNDNLSADLDSYIADLTARGWSVEHSTYSTAGTAVALKDYLKSLADSGLVGAVLVGELPFAWYQIASDGNADGQFTGPPYDFSEEFPCDLFLCDLDGLWEDDSTFAGTNSPLSPGSDGRYDSHSQDRNPEIWVCRIDASRISYTNKLELYHSYFQRVHGYREAEYTLPSQGLFYVDDDWITYFENHKTELVCDSVVEERNGTTTCADDYRGRLSKEGLYLTVLVHADPTAHYFMKPGSPTYDMFYGSELPTIKPRYGFYNLFACSNCRWIEQNPMGSIYQFYGSGLASIGSAKTGSMLDFDVFNTALGQNKCWGDAYLDLTNYWMTYYPSQGWPWDQYSRGWYMGMCLLGDATLDLGTQHPTGITEKVEPALVDLKVSPIALKHVEIRLSLPRPDRLSIAIFDAAGRLKDRIYTGELPDGEHLLLWNAENAPAGVYFVNLNSTIKDCSKKFLLMR